MLGRSAATAALFATTLVIAPSSLEAQSTVTVLLKSGDRVQGQLASFDHTTIDIRDASGQRKPLQWSDVVLLDFVGGARNLPASERDAATMSQTVIVLKGGESLKGRVVDFTNEGGKDEAVVFLPADQGQRSIPIDRVGRIYVTNFTPEALKSAGLAEPAAAVQTGAAVPDASGGATVTVSSTTRWQPTGVFVTTGENVQFSAEGTIHLRGGSEDPAVPAGALSGRTATGATVAGALAGALIGRIGESGAPFGIGNQTSLTMPATGQLYLGVNDDELSDNQGAFTVRITKMPTARPRR